MDVRINYRIQRRKLWRATWLGLCSTMLTILPAGSAERIQFFYGPFEPTIYVEDLEQLAETGEAPERLAGFTRRLSDEQLAALQDFLTIRLELSAVMMSQFSYGPVGERFIERMGQIVQTDNFLNGFYAIRAALILAADDDEAGLSVINVMRYFPSKTIQIDWPLTRQVLAENQQIFQQRDSVIANLRQLAEAQTNRGLEAPTLGLEQPGPYAWNRETFNFQNPDRSEGSLADLYLPIEPTSQQIPVVVISHGAASNRQTLAYLATHFASHGYAVVIPEHIGTSTEKFQRFLSGLEGAPDPMGLLHRPRDITAVLDTLEQRAQNEPALQSLNLESVGVLGQSLGGYTTLAVAGAELNNQPQLENTCVDTLAERPTLNLSLLIQCRLLELPESTSLAVKDERVKVAIALNPLTSHLFGEAGLGALTVPTLMVAGTDDFFVPALPEQIEPFDWIQSAQKSLLVIEKGTHFSFLEGDEEGAFPVPDGLLGPDPTLTYSPLRTLGLAFFNRHLLGQAEAEAYLTQTYVNTINPAPFQLTLVHRTSR